jgi:hypothetical protein
METIETMQLSALGQQGEPCPACGAPLAADQRYCLECGQRRGEARVDYRQHLVGAPSAGASPPSPEPQTAAAAPPDSEPGKPERDYAPLAAVGGIAVLGLMLLVGVLIGKGNSPTTTAPAPIVRVGAGAAGTTADTGSVTPDAGPSSKQANSKSKAAGAKAVKGGLTGDAARTSEAPVQASTQDLEELNSQSGDAYADTIKRLPDRIATPGAPPPIDKSKAPGGGGGALTIK